MCAKEIATKEEWIEEEGDSILYFVSSPLSATTIVANPKVLLENVFPFLKKECHLQKISGEVVKLSLQSQ